MSTTICLRGEAGYPQRLMDRLGDDAPERLVGMGSWGHLELPMTGLFGSKDAPGDVVLRTFDQAAAWRDAGRCVVSGFHSPMEQECLRILLRGRQPVVLVLARGLEGMRLKKEWREPVEDGRLLLLSPFPEHVKRPTRALAEERNRLVAALAEEVWFSYIRPGGSLEGLVEETVKWGLQVTPNC